MVTLPTGGKFYPSNSPLCGISSVEIKNMTAREEDLLSSLSEGNNENIFNTLVDGLLINKEIKAETLHEEDKLAILLSARCTGYGEDYETTAYCENCQKSTKFTFDLRKSSVDQPAVIADYDPDLDCFGLELPISGIKASIRTLTDKDAISIEKEREKKKSLNIEFNTTVSKLQRVIVSANGIKDRNAISQLAEILPAADAKTALEFQSSIFPRLNTRQHVCCSVCDTETEKEVPLTWAFFRTDI
jgi:hypothetical protein